MQSLSPSGDVINTKDFEDQAELNAKLIEAIEQSESLGAVFHVVAKFPKKGDVVDIHGLRYEVKFTDAKHGELRLKLLGLA